MACITKRQDRYVIDCYDQHGKRYRKTLPAGTTKQKARELLRDIEDRISRRAFLHEKKTPLFSEVAQQWHEHKKPNIRISTWDQNQIVLRLHLREFNDMKISLITARAVEKYLMSLREKGLKMNTIKRLLNVLNQIMAYAVRHKLIDHNPCRDAERPRVSEKELRIISALTPDQIRAFLDATPSQKYKTLFLVAVMSGARQGEILGLKWSDVDFERKQLHINRTYTHRKFFSPKTAQSRRAIDLAPAVIRELAAWKLANGAQDDDLIFPSDRNKKEPMIYQSDALVHFKKSLKAAGLNNIRFHDLRHTYASLLIDQGENIKYIQTQLGHATPMMTLNVYSHLMKSENQEAACRLENAVFQTDGHKMVNNQ
jgi:integrase